ncbi:hypothetical protein RFI_16514 [Reticulomyxa filosa]|uniref:HEAT repeat-containing protein 1 n=1 Tax=Reticulomyxa filosa TaxID=46433 RepID=X6N4L7_RETFI|nr:hypothetical protein RFI_16514 [Reticulomyxa filosa]|eukprot:ETO20704.1 hypothetical protein RFI_16514 [Reticulomyxa filosa]
MPFKEKSQPVFKGVTTEGPNLLRRKGTVHKRHGHTKPGGKKQTTINLSTRKNSNLRNQLAVLRQSSRPVADKPLKTKSSALVQKLQWEKLKAAPQTFKNLSKRSLLFSVEQTAKIDRITIYYIALSGLNELCEVDGRFNSFHQTIFSPQTLELFLKKGKRAEENFFFFYKNNQGRTPPPFFLKKKLCAPKRRGGDVVRGRVYYIAILRKRNETYDRGQEEDNKVQKKTDEEVIRLLRLLCPYFLLESAHKVLEYLVRYHKVHLNYSTYCLECCLPYHRTTTFGRFIQLLEFPTHEWQLLLTNCQKEGSPLDTQILIHQCIIDSSILNFIGQMAENVLQLPAYFAPHSQVGTVERSTSFPHSVTFSFFVTIVLRIFRFVVKEKQHQLNHFMLLILPRVIRGINLSVSSSSSPSNDPKCMFEWRLSCIMIMIYICSICQLERNRMAQLLNAFICDPMYLKPESLSGPVMETLMMAVDYLVSSQRLRALPSLSFYRLARYHHITMHSNEFTFGTLCDVWNRLALKFQLSLPTLIANQLLSYVNNNNNNKDNDNNEDNDAKDQDSAKMDIDASSSTPTLYHDFLIHLLTNFQFTHDDKVKLANSLLSIMLSAGSDRQKEFQFYYIFSTKKEIFFFN